MPLTRAVETKMPDRSLQVRGNPIRVLVLSKSVVDQTDPKYFSGVTEFAGAIHIRDLKAEKETYVEDYLLSLHTVEHYGNEVLNGGHGQYVENTKLRGHTSELCREGLKTIGATDYLAIYDKFLKVIQSPEQMANFSSGASAPTPEMKELDDAFYPLHFNTEPLSGWVKRYVTAQPWCVVVEDDGYEAAIDRLWDQAQMI